MGFFDELQQVTSAERDYLLAAPIIQQAIAGTVSQASYVAFLSQAYHHVKHTVPLLMAVGSRLDDSKDWLQMDKAGHLYATYHFCEQVSKLYRWSGVNKRKSAIIGSSTAFAYPA